jgi:YidC/Oxa1 family membrane protein insertase
MSQAADAANSGQGAGSIHVRTDVLDLDIALQGGELKRADLLQYPQVKGQAAPVRLLNSEAVGRYSLQTGLSGPAGAARPTHLALFTSGQIAYELGTSSDELRVPLTWTDGAGVTVTKTFILHRGQYRIDVQYDVQNDSTAPWQAASYAQILRDNVPLPRTMFNVESYASKGPAFDDGNKFQKLALDKDEDRALSRDIQGGWIAGLQHHFVTIVVPSSDASYHYSLQAQGQQYLLSVAGPLKTVAPGTAGGFKETLFVGPKLQVQLEAISKRLPLVADYGKYLTVLSGPLFWALGTVHNAVGNWGLAIILVTFLLKLLFYPLSESSGKSMAKMRVLAPRIKALQETYKDEKEVLGKKMMEIYQKEKINPIAGCLPMLIQMPVFFAFYWVLLESVEMRQAPFFGWIHDISSKDPFFILPILMAIAMFVQYKLNPAPADPVQAKVFMILPLVMSVTFAFFPAGLVLYWVTNTVLSIAQQWNINRRIEAMSTKARAAA